MGGQPPGFASPRSISAKKKHNLNQVCFFFAEILAGGRPQAEGGGSPPFFAVALTIL
jgi:hypothetical protein